MNRYPPTPLQSTRHDPQLVTSQNKIIKTMQQAIQEQERQIALLQHQLTLQTKYTEMIHKQVAQQTTIIQEIHKLHTTQGNTILAAIHHMSNKHSQIPANVQTTSTMQEPMQLYTNTAQKRGIQSITMEHNTDPTSTPLPL